MHFWRSVTGTTVLCLWFVAIGGLPLAMAMSLNCMSSLWIALFLLGGSALLAPERGGSGLVDGRLVAAVHARFAGVARVQPPTIGQDPLRFGFVGLGAGSTRASFPRLCWASSSSSANS